MPKFLARRPAAAVVGLSALALTLAGCGGGGDSTSSSSGGAAAGNDAKGPITLVTGKDNSGVWAPLIAKWNAANADQKVTLKEQSDKADQQHDDIVQHMQAKDPSYDVVSVDVVWTPEFAAKQWLAPLDGFSTDGMLKAPVTAATYNGKLYAVPHSSDGGMLYYRSDLVKTPPKTFDDMFKMCTIAKANNMQCFAGQYAKYEGLTVNAMEAINSYGGKAVDENGKNVINSPESVAGLKMLADAYKAGYIPQQAITYQEEQGRIAFQDGKLLFHRQWPYAYGLAQTEGSSKIKGKFAVAPLPGKSDIGASTLGGHSFGISAFSKYQGTGKAFTKWLLEPEQQKFIMEKGSLAPVMESVYKDPALVKKYPYLPTLLTSIQNAVPRPVTPFYPSVTTAIQDNAYAAIKGEKTPDQAIKDMSAAIDAATAG